MGLEIYCFNYEENGHWIAEFKKEGKCSKDLSINTKKSKEHKEEETEKSIAEPTFDTSGSAQFIEEHGDNGLILIINRAFFTPKRIRKEKYVTSKYLLDCL